MQVSSLSSWQANRHPVALRLRGSGSAGQGDSAPGRLKAGEPPVLAVFTNAVKALLQIVFHQHKQIPREKTTA